MKTILVDAVHCFIVEKGDTFGVFDDLYNLLESYPNKKLVLTGANDDEFKKFKLNESPYQVFTLKHNPDKKDPEYYKTLLKEFRLDIKDLIYFEHNPEAVNSAKSLGINTYYYDNDKKDLESLKKFLDENL
ncbi:MAG: hypothetical protein AAB510_01270 [Patescibacteria group bacterium]